MKEEDTALLEKYSHQVATFRKFCIAYGSAEGFEEVDFTGLALGFFIALGVTGDSGTGEEFYDAHVLGTICRYHLQYWEGEKL